MKNLYIISFTALLYACGGGSGSSSDNSQNIITTPSSPTNNIVSVDDNYTKGQSVEFILYLPGHQIESPIWTQTTGYPVDLLSPQSKVISFTIPTAGDYRFQIDYQINGQSKQEDISFTASDNDNSVIARLGHSVIEGNSVSLRAFIDQEIDSNTLRWVKISGPNVIIDKNNATPELLIFDAPMVSQDSIIIYQVSGQSSSGQEYSDTVGLLVEDADKISSDAIFDQTDIVATVYPYKQDSPYKDTLTQCVYSNQLLSSCTLSNLPELAKDSNGQTPTISQVMDRVVVSHDWMGKRFEEFLTTFDTNNDFKNLLRATTAIVLSYDIRPSFYWGRTGAIYLDPNNLWLTPEERDTINEAPDYRSTFASELLFDMPWRYVKDNDYISFYYPVEDRFARQLKDIEYDLANLLYHELAHANDYLTSTEWNTYPPYYSFEQAVLVKGQISSDLSALFPLNSEDMHDLAASRFLGEALSSRQKAFQPDDVAQFYKADHANDFYNYTTEREDLAMLFEELMMSVRYNILRDTAVTSNDTNYIVSWGQRGRVGVESIKERALFTTQNVLPEFDLQLAEDLPTPILMSQGLDWWDNLAITPQVISPSFYINHLETVTTKVPNSLNRYKKQSSKFLRSH